MAHLAENICGLYPGIQRDLLVTGALLHDIGKVAELCYERSFGYTDVGKLLGHIVIGVQMIEDKLREMPEFPPSQATLLKHLLLSHHGQYEYGSPKRPKTLEAVILNYLDDLDSKINGIRTHIEKEPENTDSWTAYHRIYDRYFYKESEMARDSQIESGERPPVEMEAKEDITAPPAKPRPSSSPAKASTRKEPSRDRDLRFSLADQLKGKNLELFSQTHKTEE